MAASFLWVAMISAAKGRFLDSDFGFWIGRFACCPWSRVSSHSGVTKRHPPYRSGFCLYVNRNSEMDKRPPYRPGFRVYVNPKYKIKLLPPTVSGYGDWQVNANAAN